MRIHMYSFGVSEAIDERFVQTNSNQVAVYQFSLSVHLFARACNRACVFVRMFVLGWVSVESDPF